MKHVSELEDLLDLEKIEENIFRGENFQAPWKRVFGGQVLAQSISAAYETVPDDRFIHSMHCYFILPGDINLPIIYQVERARDGGSFTTRRVVAIQKGRPIFVMASSFQLKQAGLSHQIEMPEVVGPDNLVSDHVLIERLKEKYPNIYAAYKHDRPIEFRPVGDYGPMLKKDMKPLQYVWFRAKGKLSGGIRNQHKVLAYASDYNLLTTATLPHRTEISDKNVFVASIDHAMWIHHRFDISEWHLYALDSPSASNSRGFTRGSVFSKEGKLVASVTQEGLIRIQ